jgi:endonuclease/exonuclease/phosphatase family metal-dependent hydrolase/regulation of enolase protein 1 (concanavalin A-like superfamily)
MPHVRTRTPGVVFALMICLGAVAHADAGLPDGWTSADIGSVGINGTASASGNVFTVEGAGDDIWDAADALRFTYTRLTGDGEIIARLDSLQPIAAWTKAGVMIRETLNANARHAFMLASAGKGYAFQRRTTTGGASSNIAGGGGTVPVFVRLIRSGSTFTAYRSSDGRGWSTVGSASITMAATVYVGLAVSSHDRGRLTAASFSNVVVGQSVQAGWRSADIGPVGGAGSASAGSGTMDVTGAGEDIWGAADRFRFTYTTLTGDGELVAQVRSIQNISGWTKAGVMMRESLRDDARHAFMLVSAGKGLAFQRRTSTSALSTSTAGGSGGPGSFVKLVRKGTLFTASRSADGSHWTAVGSATIAMSATIHVGLAVSSHVDGTLATANFSGTTVRSSTTAVSGTTSGSSSTSTSTTATLRVLHWNLHHGVGTDGKYDINRIATWIAKSNPDVVSLNEVEKYTYWGNEDQPARYKALLESKTGRTWYMVWAQEYGQWTSNGKGNLLLSRFPFSVTARHELSYERTAALAQVVVNGRNVAIATTHLDPDSGSRRLTQSKELVAWLDGFSGTGLVAGDMNAQPTSTEMTLVKNTYVDAWAAAKSGGYAYSSSDNPYGYTRNSRIDFVFTAKTATALAPIRVEVIDTRDANNVMPSDHRPVLAVYTVR